MIFLNCLCCFYFFNIKLVENFALYFFFFKTLWITTLIPHIFFLWIFSKLSVNFIFLILSWLTITTVYFLTRHYRLLQCFPTWFFSFFYVFFLKLFLYFFLENIIDYNSFSSYNFFMFFFYESTTIHKHATSPRQCKDMTSSVCVERGGGS